MVSGAVLVAAFTVVAAAAAFLGARLYRLGRPSQGAEPPDD